MSLHKVDDNAFDYVVSSVMLMDVSDHKKVFEAAYRVLKPNGRMIWVIMHPCFQSPFSYPLGDGSRKIILGRPQCNSVYTSDVSEVSRPFNVT